MKKILLIAAMAVVTAGIVSFTVFNTQVHRKTNETISGYVSTLYGANDVEVIFDRTGPDAGQGCVSFDVDIRFNSETITQTFHFNMYDGQTHLDTHVQGPNPTGDADVHGDPYNYDYVNCY